MNRSRRTAVGVAVLAAALVAPADAVARASPGPRFRPGVPGPRSRPH